MVTRGIVSPPQIPLGCLRTSHPWHLHIKKTIHIALWLMKIRDKHIQPCVIYELYDSETLLKSLKFYLFLELSL